LILIPSKGSYVIIKPLSCEMNTGYWISFVSFKQLFMSLAISAVSAAVGVITAVNEHIIETAPTQMRVNATVPPSFPYSLCISALKNLEPLIEVAAQQYYGDDKRWNFIAVTEAMK